MHVMGAICVCVSCDILFMCSVVFILSVLIVAVIHVLRVNLNAALHVFIHHVPNCVMRHVIENHAHNHVQSY